jgi:hypothetical protein
MRCAALCCAVEKQNPSGRMRGSLLLGLDSKDRVPPSAFSLLLAAWADRPAFLTLQYRLRAEPKRVARDGGRWCGGLTGPGDSGQGASALRPSRTFDGGLIARLFASEHGDEVAGLVLVDALSEDLYNGLTGALIPRNCRLFQQNRAQNGHVPGCSRCPLLGVAIRWTANLK